MMFVKPFYSGVNLLLKNIPYINRLKSEKQFVNLKWIIP